MAHRHRARVFAVALAAAAVLTAAAPASAASTWLPATPLSATGQSALDLAVVMAPNGTVVATWSRFDSVIGNFRIEGTVRPPGGSFSSVAELSVGPTGATLDQLATDA